jgi:biopolymer transport protein ExbB/TolQ
MASAMPKSRQSSRLSREFMFQMAGLLLIVVAVHASYVGIVRPLAQEQMVAEQIALSENPEATQERSVWIILRDPEQEICIILLLWALLIMGGKLRNVYFERQQLQRDLISVIEGQSILVEDARDYARAIEALEPEARESLYARALHSALRRFQATHNLQNVSEAVDSVCSAEHERMDSELAMVRYIAWAIPSIGFIGTVRGIGGALALAHQAVEGNITGVTASLGTAFNSTLVALLLSIVVMFALYQVQQLQERLVLDTQTACDHDLIQHMKVRV